MKTKAVGVVMLICLFTIVFASPAYAGPCNDQLVADLNHCNDIFPEWYETIARAACYGSAYLLFDTCIAEVLAESGSQR
jgi:hypothetical protein